MILHLNNFQSPPPKDALCQIWLKLAQQFWRRKYINFVDELSLFHDYLPLEKGGIVPILVEIGHMVLLKKRLGPPFKQTWIPLTQGLCQVWLKSPSGSREEDFLIASMYFRYFVIISPWKRVGPFIWTNLNSLHPRMHCVKYGWNWLGGLEKKIF